MILFQVIDLILFLGCTCPPISGCVSNDALDSDWGVFRRRNHFYADRTAFIKTVIGIDRAYVLRPPRFGKTLFLSMLKYYFDEYHKNCYDIYFAGLDIYDLDAMQENPTHNTYQVFHISLPKTYLDGWAGLFRNKISAFVKKYKYENFDLHNANELSHFIEDQQWTYVCGKLHETCFESEK